MIVCNIELVSAISRDRDKRQAKIKISNVGGTAKHGSYKYEILGKRGQILATGVIHGFPRKRLLAVDLLLACLLDARGERLLKEIK